ncbi:MAG: hypothetical protein J6Q26_01210, partial [Bacteroidales bacterium]|nr:hypothetical protein [Bacteroidales bacterium]
AIFSVETSWLATSSGAASWAEISSIEVSWAVVFSVVVSGIEILSVEFLSLAASSMAREVLWTLSSGKTRLVIRLGETRVESLADKPKLTDRQSKHTQNFM